MHVYLHPRSRISFQRLSISEVLAGPLDVAEHLTLEAWEFIPRL